MSFRHLFEARPFAIQSRLKHALPFVKYCYQHYLINKLIKKFFAVHYSLSLSSSPVQSIQPLLIRVITFQNWYKKKRISLACNGLSRKINGFITSSLWTHSERTRKDLFYIKIYGLSEPSPLQQGLASHMATLTILIPYDVHPSVWQWTPQTCYSL